MSEAIIRPASEQKNLQAAYIRAAAEQKNTQAAYIRTAAEQDIPQIHSIFSWYVQHTAVAFDYDPPALEDFADRMRKIMDSYPFLVSEQDGRVTGYACAHAFVGREAYAWNVCLCRTSGRATSRHRCMATAVRSTRAICWTAMCT